MRIRILGAEETDLLKDFLYEAIFIPEGVEPPDRSIIELPELRVYYEDFGKGRADHCVVADDDGKVVGAVWSRIMNDYGHIDDETPSLAISLYKEYRGKGIGTLLMRDILALLREKGYSRASLAVQKANYAVRMYEKVGFRTVGENEQEYIMVCSCGDMSNPYVLDGGRYRNMSRELNWAVLGTGVIANQMAAGLQKMGKSLYAVGNRTHSKAVAFAEKYGITKVYGTIDEMFYDDNVDIIYITSPHNTHYGFMKKALENGKHLFVEKSITLNSQELDEMIALAESKGLILAEAMTIWHMPLYKELWRIVRSGELGRVQMITVNFGSFKEYNMANRFFNRNLAGGAMLDIGVYALSIVRSFMDETPASVLSQWKPAPTGVDEQATILLQNSVGQMATVALTMHSKQPKRAMISCEKAYIEIMEFPRADRAVITDAETGERREVIAGETENALFYELTDMENAVATGDADCMKLGYSKDVMDIMTALRNEWGLVYPEEE